MFNFFERLAQFFREIFNIPEPQPVFRADREALDRLNDVRDFFDTPTDLSFREARDNAELQHRNLKFLGVVSDEGGQTLRTLFSEYDLVTLNGGEQRFDAEIYATGGDADDVAFGSAGRDILFGKGGDDELNGGDGRDFIDGGVGDDLLRGGAGDDRIKGGDGDDLILGGEGDDELFGNGGSDVIDGGAGDDVIYFDTNARSRGGKDTLRGGDGDDTILIAGGRAEGGAGDDQITVQSGDARQRTIVLGGAGDDSLSVVRHDRALREDERDAAGDVLDGGAGDDKLDGAEGNDVFLFRDGGGHDAIFGFGVGQSTFLRGSFEEPVLPINLGNDLVVIDKAGVDGFDDLTIVELSRNEVEFRFEDGDTLRLTDFDTDRSGTLLSHLNEQNILFTDADAYLV